MAFGASAYLSTMYAPASKDAVAEEVRKLLAVLGETSPSATDELITTDIRQNMLAELVMWNRRVAPNPHRDSVGDEAVKFWAAQALARSVMRPEALDPEIRYSAKIENAMARGADGLFEVGRSQFETLAKAANDLVSWMLHRKHRRFAIIESPLGNSVPVQVVSDLARLMGVECVPVEWNPPRNDRPSRGRTINQAAQTCVDETQNFELVVLLDDAITGSRYIKLFDALVDRIGRKRFLPIVLGFEDTLRPVLAENPNRERLVARVNEQANRIGYSSPIVAFPLQPLFKIDWGPHVRWETPIVWGDSDLIAGKRKINFIFTLIGHCFGILEDLGAEESVFRAYLERAWQEDTTGSMFQFAPGLVQSMFKGIASQLDDLQEILWAGAKNRFPDDYLGKAFADHDAGTRDRWVWLREEFVRCATERLDEQRAAVAWKAIDDTFAASFTDHVPRPSRDQDAAPFTIPYNSTVAQVNRRLRQRICSLV